jgi:hypothetical protein
MVNYNLGPILVTIPFFFYQSGIILGTCGLALGCYLNLKSLQLLFAANKNCPHKIESLYELGFVTMGRAGIYLVAAANAITSIGAAAFALMVCGDNLSTISITLA